MSRKLWILPLLPLLDPALAAAYCVSGTGPWAKALRPIRVRLDSRFVENPGAGLDCPAGCSLDQVSRAVRANLDEFHDNSGANLRFAFFGTIDTRGEAFSPGELVILTRDRDCPGRAWATWRDLLDHSKSPPVPGTDGFIDQANVAFCTDGMAWGPWMDGAVEGFTHNFIHEVMHTLDFLHPHDMSPGCVNGTPSVLSYTGMQASHLYKDDIDGLQRFYGLRDDRTARSSFSVDQVTWLQGPTEEAASITSLGRMSACDNLPAAGSTFVGYAVDSHLARVPRVSEATPSQWTDRGVLSITEKTHYPVGMACADRSRMRLFYLGDYAATPSSGQQRIKYFETSNGWRNISGPFVFDEAAEGFSQGTNTSGLDATFDPVSGRYVVVWRSSGSQIASKVEGGRPAYYNQANSERLLASDTPAVACGATGTLGPWNCIVAWADTDWDRVLKWAHARVVSSPFFGPRLEIGEIRSQGYFVVGGPSVAVVNSGRLPWQIAFHQGGSATYVLRKAADPGALWQDERGFSYGQKVVSPGLGSARLGPFPVGFVFLSSSN